MRDYRAESELTRGLWGIFWDGRNNLLGFICLMGLETVVLGRMTSLSFSFFDPSSNISMGGGLGGRRGTPRLVCDSHCPRHRSLAHERAGSPIWGLPPWPRNCPKSRYGMARGGEILYAAPPYSVESTETAMWKFAKT